MLVNVTLPKTFVIAVIFISVMFTKIFGTFLPKESFTWIFMEPLSVTSIVVLPYPVSVTFSHQYIAVYVPSSKLSPMVAPTCTPLGS